MHLGYPFSIFVIMAIYGLHMQISNYLTAGSLSYLEHKTIIIGPERKRFNIFAVASLFVMLCCVA